MKRIGQCLDHILTGLKGYEFGKEGWEFGKEGWSVYIEVDSCHKSTTHLDLNRIQIAQQLDLYT